MEQITHWVRQVQSTGDVDAFTHLVGAFEEMAMATAYARLGCMHEAEDACQEAFFAAYLNLHQLDDPAAFAGWFRRVVFKYADRIARVQHRQIPLEKLPIASVNRALGDERQSAVMVALRTLPERDRLITSLYYGAQCSIAQVAEFVEVSEALVKKTLQQTRDALRQEVAHMQKHSSRSTPSVMKEKIAFFLNVRQLNMSRIQQSLLQYPQWVNARDMPDEEPAQWYLPHFGRATPLMWAVHMQQLPLCQLLLSHGADPNIFSANGMSALLEAVQGRLYDIVSLLLEAGAQAHVPFGAGKMTPLHVAASKGDAHLLRMLFQYDVQPDAPDAQQRTALDWARLKGHEAIYQKSYEAIFNRRHK